MDGQRAALNESLLAWLVIARVRTFVGMDAIVSLEIRFAIETLQRNQYRGLERCA